MSGHIPVQLSDVMQALALQPNDHVVDGTFGAGGYSRAILEAQKDATLYAIDQDPKPRSINPASCAVVVNGSCSLSLQIAAAIRLDLRSSP